MGQLEESLGGIIPLSYGCNSCRYPKHSQRGIMSFQCFLMFLFSSITISSLPSISASILLVVWVKNPFSSSIPHSWGSQALTQHSLFICREIGIVQLSLVLCHLEGEQMLTNFNLTFQMLPNTCFCSSGVLQSFLRKDGLLKILCGCLVKPELSRFFSTTLMRASGQFTGSSQCHSIY